MANKRIKDLPSATSTTTGDILPIDGTTTRGITVEDFLADNLVAIKGLTSAADKGIQFTGSGTAATYDLTTAGKALLDDADAAAQRTTLGLVIGTNVQAYDAGLQSISGLTTAADKMIYTTASDTYAVTTVTSYARTLLDDTDAATARSTLGASTIGATIFTAADAAAVRAAVDLEPGTDVQAYNARLADIAGITFAQGDILYFDGTNIVKLTKGTDGQFLKIGATIPEWATLAGGGDMLAANNLSDVADAATALANIGGVSITRVRRNITGTTDTLVLTDQGKFIYTTNGSATTITVPPNSSVAFPVGTQIDFAQYAAGKVTFAQGSGVTINSVSSLKSIAAQNGAATLVKQGTDEWLLTGYLGS